jgi:hypothetical protein
LQNGKACVFGRLGRQKERSRRSVHKTIELIRARLRIWHLNRRFLLFAASRFAAQLFGKHRQRIGFFFSETPRCFIITFFGHAHHEVQRLNPLPDILGNLAKLSLSSLCKHDCVFQMLPGGVPGFARKRQPLFLPTPKYFLLDHDISPERMPLECYANEGYFNRGPVWRLWAILSKVMIRVGFGIDQTESGAQKSDP